MGPLKFLKKVGTGIVGAVTGAVGGLITGTLKGFARGFGAGLEIAAGDPFTAGIGLTVGFFLAVGGTLVGAASGFAVGLGEGAYMGAKSEHPLDYTWERMAQNMNFEDNDPGLMSLLSSERKQKISGQPLTESKPAPMTKKTEPLVTTTPTAPKVTTKPRVTKTAPPPKPTTIASVEPVLPEATQQAHKNLSQYFESSSSGSFNAKTKSIQLSELNTKLAVKGTSIVAQNPQTVPTSGKQQLAREMLKAYIISNSDSVPADETQIFENVGSMKPPIISGKDPELIKELKDQINKLGIGKDLEKTKEPVKLDQEQDLEARQEETEERRIALD